MSTIIYTIYFISFDCQVLVQDCFGAIFYIIWFIVGGLICIAQGVSDFNRIYPTRYGRNHVEIKGIVVGEKDMRVGRFGRIVKIPVIQFIWEGKIYEIADETNYLFKICEIGDEVIVCFNPTKNEKIAIIKRGKFALETVWAWLWWFIVAIGAFFGMILGILVLMKVIG